jgi:hypothetical protein
MSQHPDTPDQKKSVQIMVNGIPQDWPKDDITFDQVVTFAYPDHAQHPEITYSVKFTRGHGNKPEGVLAPGGSVQVKDGMSFTVSRTGQS